MKNIAKPICFYLPQFHPIPENDEAYGEGFTEWTNVKKAKPLFEGHYQPRVPKDNNYYSLLDKETMVKQVKLAKQYGIYGFCYYHYWFSGNKKLLEKPVEMMLESKDIDMPFCLCWANENWSKRWDGGNNELIVKQDYGNDAELREHIRYLCDFFKDPRYILIDGAPLFIIYKPELIPNLRHVVKHIRKYAREFGVPKIRLAVQYPEFYFNKANLRLFDYYIEFEPQFIQDYVHDCGRGKLQKFVKSVLLSIGAKGVVGKIEAARTRKVTEGKVPELLHCNYDEYWSSIISHAVTDKRMMAGAFVDWDNTARNKNGKVFDGANPEKFGQYIKSYNKKIQDEYSTPYLFINAWNEWAEGAYLEPDEKYGFQYLEALDRGIRYN